MTPRWHRGDETRGFELSTQWDHISLDYRGFYFWDETQTEAFGPFRLLEECLQSMKRYASTL